MGADGAADTAPSRWRDLFPLPPLPVLPDTRLPTREEAVVSAALCSLPANDPLGRALILSPPTRLVDALDDVDEAVEATRDGTLKAGAAVRPAMVATRQTTSALVEATRERTRSGGEAGIRACGSCGYSPGR